MPYHLFTRPMLIGLDIQPHEIRWLRVSQTRNDLIVENFEIMPRASILEPDAAGYWSTLQASLTAIVAAHAWQNLPVALAIRATDVINKSLRVKSGLSNAEINTAILKHIQHELPGMDVDICLDYALMSPPTDTEQEILFVATRGETLQRYLDTVQAAGLKVKIVDVDYYALLRGACYGLRSSHQAIGLLLLDEVRSIFIIAQDGKILLAQEWTLIDADRPARLHQCLQLYTANEQTSPIEKILLCTVAMTEEIAVIKKMCMVEYRIPVEIINPWSKLSLNAVCSPEKFQHYAPRLLQCLGLVMREVPRW